ASSRRRSLNVPGPHDEKTAMSPSTRTSDAAPAEPAVGWLRGVIVDAIDPERLGAFWQEMLGVPVHEREPGWLELEFGPRGSLMAVPPVDPVAHAPGRIRIDIEITDLDAATARVEVLGGALKEIVRFKPGE